MRTRKLAPRIGAAALTLTALALASHEALAAEYWLDAGASAIADPNGSTAQIAVWGYASCSGGFATCGSVSLPGPALTVPAGDTTLTVHLRNSLPNVGTTATPTSLVINGLYKPMAPVFTVDADVQARRRVRSFDAEAAPGGTQDYTWTNVQPGTYLYQSGTQPQLQVQMGLYGALSKNAVEAVSGTNRAQAYAGVANEYDSQATLLYSEIDPAFHAAVATGAYGGPGWTSTLNYDPKYFLINGAPFQFGSTPSIAAAGTTLLRLLNAGLTTHVPSIHGRYWDVIAEDGKAYPFRQNQYTALMPAAKTLDLLLTPPDIGGATYPIVDRRLNLSNNGAANGGMLAFLSYGAAGVVGGGGSDNTPNSAPVANADTYSSIAGIELTVGVAQGVLSNDTDPDNLPQPLKAVAASGLTTAGGSFVLNANGSFTYKAPAVITADPTADTFTYRVTDGKALSAAAGTVTINLSAPALPPTTLLDNFDRTDSVAGLGPKWDQAASTVTSNPNLQLLGNAVVAADTDAGGLAIWIDGATQGATQYASFSSVALDKSALVLKATGGTTKQPANFVRVRVEGPDVVVATLMSGNAAAVYAKQASFPATSAGTLSAVVDDKGLVTVFLNGSFVGGVQLPDVGVWKGTGRIGVQMQKPGASLDDFGGGTL